jgi:hypothetical protein
MMLVAIHSALFGVVYLIMLNGFLHGSKKDLLDAVLSIAWVAVIAIAFWFLGWQMGLLAILLSLLYALIARPLAAPLAAKLLRPAGASGRHIGLPCRQLLACSKAMDSSIPIGDGMSMLHSIQRMKDSDEQFLEYLYHDERVRQVLADNGVSHEILRELLTKLTVSGARQWAGGHFVAASALAYPHTLSYILLKAPHGRNAWLETTYRLIEHFESGVPLEESSDSPQ